MVIFGWDASHYDGPLNRTILAQARAEGISFFTHKIAEGLSDTEGTMDDTALAAARDAGIPFVGGYLVPRSTTTAAAQVTRWLQLADAGEPWWRTFPGWFWQVDLERWPYDNVPASVGIDCARRLRDATGRAVILYASHNQYGDSLGGWDGPLWNADYVSRTAAGFAAMYPGDNWTPSHGTWTGGWAPYSGKTPTILQYTSSATIAGLTTCDANAFRGMAADFARLIGGDDMANLGYGDRDGEFLCERERALLYLDKGTMGPEKGVTFPVVELLKRLDASVAALVGRPALQFTDDQTAAIADRIASALAAHPDTPLGDADKPAIVAAVKQALAEGVA